jgi:ATP-dependent Clp protease adapter protein ClpS
MSQHPNRPGIPQVPSQNHHIPAKQDRPHSWRLPSYRVILHYHAGNDLMAIVWTVMELMRFCRTEATHKMWQAYHCGRASLLTTYKERAELYVEQFASKQLIVTIEPA